MLASLGKVSDEKGQGGSYGARSVPHPKLVLESLMASMVILVGMAVARKPG